ncbi:MAG: cyclophilin-like fold protein [Alphaproteobacteria bacterium]
MGRRFTMDFGGSRVVAELIEDKAPNVCRAFTRALPAKVFTAHAKFAGEELIVMVPFFCNPENEILDVKPGDIGYYPGRQTICIFYGDTRPFGHVSVFARVVEGLGKLRPVGRKVLRAGPVAATFRLA